MPVLWILSAALGALGLFLLLWLALQWVARSWEPIDDDQLHERLSGLAHPARAPGLWLRMLGWFTGGPRRQTYRRDKRGRFRKIWRG
jgi:hypothetical protein